MKIELIDYGLKKWPQRAHYNDAGLDCFVCLEKSEIILKATSTLKIPLGFGIKIPDGYTGFICPRSGLSSLGITCELSPIDSGYTGQIHAIVTNNNNYDYIIKDGQKIGQLIIIPCVICDLVNTNSMINEKKRENNGFGSTDKKEIFK